jgi:hypothetical protein
MYFGGDNMIFKISTKEFQTMSSHPNDNWLNDHSYIVIPDESELANKIINIYPYFDCVLDKDGNLIDIAPTEIPEPPAPEPTETDQINAKIDYIAMMTGVEI